MPNTGKDQHAPPKWYVPPEGLLFAAEGGRQSLTSGGFYGFQNTDPLLKYTVGG